MTRRALIVCLLALAPLASSMFAQAQDLSGKWSGSFLMTMNGEERPDSIYMNLTQKDKTLTGTAGPNADRQWTMLNGKVDGNKVTFDVQSEGPIVKFTLTLADGRLKGDALAEMDGQSMSAKVDVGRVK